LRAVLIVCGVLVALVLLGTAGTVLAFPFGVAAACPACYGFERLPANIFIERAASSLFGALLVTPSSQEAAKPSP